MLRVVGMRLAHSKGMHVLARILAVLLATLATSHVAGSASAEGQSVWSEVAVLTRHAGRVFRGTCIAAETGFAQIGGGRLVVTTYTFEVAEHLKGPRDGPSLQFRQVGTPQREGLDLGRLGGCPSTAWAWSICSSSFPRVGRA